MNEKTKNTIQLIIPIALCVIFVIFPIFELIALCTGLEFRIHGEAAFAIIFALFAIASTVFLFIFKPKYKRVGKILLTLAAPLSLLTSICFICGDWAASVIFALIWSGCVFALYIKLVPDSNFKAAAAVVSVLLAIAFVVIYLWGVIYSAFISKTEINSTYPSIDGYYQAELGTEKSLISTKTVIYISRTDAEFGVLLGSFWKKPLLVYEGEDYEVKTAQINWLDESTVIINGEEYAVG